MKQIELLIDKRIVLTQRTDAEAAAPGVITTLNLDTRSLANGTHEIYLRAYNTRCTPSIPDYQGAGAESGAYFPLHIKVQNSAVMAAVPDLDKKVFLPVVTYTSNSMLPNSCSLSAQTAAAPGKGSTQPFAAPSYYAVRNEQRLLICEL